MTDKEIHMHVNMQTLESSAKQQFDECCANDFVTSAALMPDAHTGYVAPIGSVIQTRGAIVPGWVGYDIGCGMLAVRISSDKDVQDAIKEKGVNGCKENCDKLFDIVNESIPMGVGRHNLDRGDKKFQTPYKIFLEEEMNEAIKKLKFSRYAKDIECEIIEEIDSMEDFNLIDETHRLSTKNLGTLGSGNHFIEILEHGDETWLVIHSGSRGVGHYIGSHFIKLAFRSTYFSVATWTGETQGHSIFDDNLKKQYMAYHNYCLEFALLNRLSMAEKVREAIFHVLAFDFSVSKNIWTNKNHNHCVEIEPDVYLHRKGATSSGLDELGVIPANMRDGCFLVRGLGNPDFLNSSSHGAGRALSRGEAKRTITLEQFQEQMIGITAPVGKDTIDESPMAYKDIFEVMELQKGSVEVIKHLKPIINWKG